MEIKNIAVVAYPTRTLGGGVATLVESFSKKLEDDGFNVKKVAILENPKYDSNLDWITISKKKYLHTRKIWHINKIFHNLKFLFNSNFKGGFLEEIKDSDLVIATDPYIIPFLNKEQKNIFQVHTSLQSFSFYKIMVIFLLKLYKKRINKITFLDAKDEKILAKYCENVANVKNFSPINIHEININDKNNKLVYFGLLQKFKNIPSIMQFASDNEIYIDIYGPLIDYAEDELRKYDSEFVNLYIGRYNLEEKITEFSKYKALIMNSKIEGEPVAILEALSLGMCVITPRSLDNLTQYLEEETIYFDEIDKIKNLIYEDTFFSMKLDRQRKMLKTRNVESYLQSHDIV